MMPKVNAVLQILLILFLGLSWEQDFFIVAEPLKRQNHVLRQPLSELVPLPEKYSSTEITCVQAEMPYLSACDHLAKYSDRKACSDEMIINIIAENFKPPSESLCHPNIGLISFVIDTTGKRSDLKVAKSIDPEFDKEALRIVNMLPPFEPGRQFGKPVKVWYNLPFRIRPE